MTFSVKVDEAAARFFRTMLSEEDQIKDFVSRFIADIDSAVSSEKSFETMDQWQEFLRASLGDISDLTEPEIIGLDKALRHGRPQSCSMVTQSLSAKHGEMRSTAETPLYSKYSIFLPAMNKLV